MVKTIVKTEMIGNENYIHIYNLAADIKYKVRFKELPLVMYIDIVDIKIISLDRMEYIADLIDYIDDNTTYPVTIYVYVNNVIPDISTYLLNDLDFKKDKCGSNVYLYKELYIK